MQMLILLFSLIVFLIVFDELLAVQSWLFQRKLSLRDLWHLSFGELVRRTTDKSMIESLFVQRHVFSGVRVDVESLHVIPINNSICLATNIVSSIVLKTLTVEVLSKSSIREIPGLLLQRFKLLPYQLLFFPFLSSSSSLFSRLILTFARLLLIFFIVCVRNLDSIFFKGSFLFIFRLLLLVKAKRKSFFFNYWDVRVWEISFSYLGTMHSDMGFISLI